MWGSFFWASSQGHRCPHPRTQRHTDSPAGNQKGSAHWGDEEEIRKRVEAALPWGRDIYSLGTMPEAIHGDRRDTRLIGRESPSAQMTM